MSIIDSFLAGQTPPAGKFQLIGFPPLASVSQAVAQSIPTGSGILTDLIPDTLNLDTDGITDLGGANPERLTFQTLGAYLLIVTVLFQSVGSPAGLRRVLFGLNGSTNLSGLNVSANVANTPTTITGTRLLVAGAGDFITAQVGHTQGAPTNCTLSELAVIRLGGT